MTHRKKREKTNLIVLKRLKPNQTETDQKINCMTQLLTNSPFPVTLCLHDVSRRKLASIIHKTKLKKNPSPHQLWRHKGPKAVKLSGKPIKNGCSNPPKRNGTHNGTCGVLHNDKSRLIPGVTASSDAVRALQSGKWQISVTAIKIFDALELKSRQLLLLFSCLSLG